MADVETVRTVFKTEWLGAGVVQNMIRQYGMAKKAMDSVGSGGAGTGGTAAFSKTAQFTRAMSAMQAGLVKELDAGSISAAQAEKAFAGYGAAMQQSLGITAETSAATGVLGTGLSGLTVALGAAAVAVGALALGFKALYPVLEEGATVAQLDQSFSHLVATMTESPNLLKDMKEAARGTLSTMAAQEGIMTLVAGSSQEMTQALADAAPRILEISKAANKLNPALGTTNFMFTSLAKGLKRAEPRLIDNLGLKLRVSDANRQMAAELGKSVMQLTAEEKQMAILNETLRAGTKLIEQVGGSIDGLGDPFLRINVASEDFKASLKESLFYAIGISDTLDNISSYMNEITDVREYKNFLNQMLDAGLIGADELQKWTAGVPNQEAINANMAEIARRRAQRDRELSEVQQWSDAMSQARLESLEQERRDARILGVGGAGASILPDYLADPSAFDRSANIIAVAADKAEEALKDEAKALKEQEDALEASIKTATKWADATEKAAKDARDAWKDYERGLITTTAEHLAAADDAGYYTTAIENIGDAWVTTGGATAEQAELLEKLQKGYDKAAGSIDDLSTGVKGFGFDEEKMGKEVETATEQMAWFEQKIGAIDVAETKGHATHQAAIWDWEKLSESLFGAANAADLSIDQYARVGIALGEVSAEQAAAAISATGMGAQMSAALEKVRLGEIEPEDILAELEKAAMFMRNNPIEVLITPKYDALSHMVDPKERIRELLNREDDKLDMNLAIDEDRLMALWKERILGLEEEPPHVDVILEMNEAQTAFDVFKSENSEMWVQVHLDEFSAIDVGQIGSRIPTKAGGGNVLRDTPIIVGEQGPELIVPGSNSTVLPDGAAGGGISMNVAMTINGSVGVDDLTSIVEDTLMEAMQQIGIV